MSERFFDLWRVDVFTDVPLQGNPLAVFPRAAGLSKEEMEAVTREMNLSETTFVFPPTNPAANYRNRIFTPNGEIPFAGHPSIGTAYVAALEGLVPKPEGASVVYQELEIGVLPLELLVEGGTVQKVVMTQGEPSVGDRLGTLANLASALGVKVRDLGTGKLVPQLASTGIPSLQVPLKSLALVKGLDPDMRELGAVLSKLGPNVVCYVFSLEAESPDAQVHARAFAPSSGVPEDPATGSAAGACGAYLATNKRLPAPSFVIEQGVEMRHRSRIEVSVEMDGSRPKVVRVGGRVTPVIRGTLRLPHVAAA
jgi:trans-2,3-dihydro-3-hydroxyanthranilate isomerase